MIRLFLEQCRKLYFNNDYDNTVSKVDWGSGIYYVSKNSTYKHSATTILLGKMLCDFPQVSKPRVTSVDCEKSTSTMFKDKFVPK